MRREFACLRKIMGRWRNLEVLQVFRRWAGYCERKREVRKQLQQKHNQRQRCGPRPHRRPRPHSPPTPPIAPLAPPYGDCCCPAPSGQ